MNSTRIIEKLTYDILKDKMCGLDIVVGAHAFDLLSESQRKLFKDEELIRTLKREKPILAGLQKNGYYSTYFRRKNGYLKIIFNIKPTKIEIVTFMYPPNIPSIR